MDYAQYVSRRPPSPPMRDILHRPYVPSPSLSSPPAFLSPREPLRRFRKDASLLSTQPLRPSPTIPTVSQKQNFDDEYNALAVIVSSTSDDELLRNRQEIVRIRLEHMLTTAEPRTLRVLALALQRCNAKLDALELGTQHVDQVRARMRAIESRHFHGTTAASRVSPELRALHIRRGGIATLVDHIRCTLYDQVRILHLLTELTIRLDSLCRLLQSLNRNTFSSTSHLRKDRPESQSQQSIDNHESHSAKKKATAPATGRSKSSLTWHRSRLSFSAEPLYRSVDDTVKVDPIIIEPSTKSTSDESNTSHHHPSRVTSVSPSPRKQASRRVESLNVRQAVQRALPHDSSTNSSHIQSGLDELYGGTEKRENVRVSLEVLSKEKLRQSHLTQTSSTSSRTLSSQPATSSQKIALDFTCRGSPPWAMPFQLLTTPDISSRVDEEAKSNIPPTGLQSGPSQSNEPLQTENPTSADNNAIADEEVRNDNGHAHREEPRRLSRLRFRRLRLQSQLKKLWIEINEIYGIILTHGPHLVEEKIVSRESMETGLLGAWNTGKSLSSTVRTSFQVGLVQEATRKLQSIVTWQHQLVVAVRRDLSQERRVLSELDHVIHKEYLGSVNCDSVKD